MAPIDGIHHITLITGDAARNVDFYVRVLGLRLVKKSVNQDDPTVYHLFYSDEQGSPGADITFFAYQGVHHGRAGAGMVASIVHRVASQEALDFWAQRLAAEGVDVRREPSHLQFHDPEGMSHELTIEDVPDEPLVARSNQIPAEHALQGFAAVRAIVGDRARSEALVRDALGFKEVEEHVWEARGESRGGRILFEQTDQRGVAAGGTVHHVAWSVTRAEQDGWRERVAEFGARPTQIIDRFYFESVYFREPSGILYELATLDGAGFTADEPFQTLGESLSLPPDYEHLRGQLASVLAPLPDVRQWRPAPDAEPA